MSTYHHILVVVDPKHTQQPAIKRSLELAKKLGSQLIFVSCIYDTNYEFTSMLTSNERNTMKSALLHCELEKLQGLIKVEGAADFAKCKAVWHKKQFQGIIDTAEQQRCDLIVKSTKPHSKLSQRLITPNDWRLLRNSPINVLMVKNHDWPINGNIVSAISVDDNDDRHECLSQRIVDESRKVADLVNGKLHLANTYPSVPMHMSIEVPQFSPDVYNTNLRKRHEVEMKKLASKINLPAECLHIEEGMPENVIPNICEQLDAELLVLGSVGRKGLSAALLGNTAEHIIDKINCDTLVIKPLLN